MIVHIQVVMITTDVFPEEDSLLESLRWIVEFMDICPEEVLPFTPRILAHLLPAMASNGDSIRQAAGRVNTALMDYVVSLSDDTTHIEPTTAVPSRIPTSKSREAVENDRRDSSTNTRGSLSSSKELEGKRAGEVLTPPPPPPPVQ